MSSINYSVIYDDYGLYYIIWQIKMVKTQDKYNIFVVKNVRYTISKSEHNSLNSTWIKKKEVK